MPKHIEYYLSMQSPWTFLGHQRLVELAKKRSATLSITPLNYADVFPATGGLPLPKRAPARKAYRMMELKRWRDELEIPITLEPAFFPVDEKLASRLVVAIRETSQEKAIEFAGKALSGVWIHEANIADPKVMLELVNDCALDGEALLARAQNDEILERLNADTAAAIEKGIFGAPTYVVDGELFWGQDRLHFLEQRL